MAEQNDSSVSFALQEQLAVLHKLLQEKPGGCTGDTRRAEHLITASERREEKDAKFQELREHLNKVLTEQVAESHQHRESAGL
jgi:hypothetical protein